MLKPRSIFFSKFPAASIVLAASTLCAADWPMFRGSPDLRGATDEKIPAKPALLWTFKTGSQVRSTAAIVANQVFIGSNDGNVYALNATNGQKLWAFKTGDRVESPPLVLDGKVFVGSADGWLYALDAKTGKQLWKYETGDKILGAANWVVSRTAQAADLLSPRGTSGERNEERGIPENPASSPRPSPPPTEEREKTPSSSNLKTNILIGSYDFRLHCVDAATGKSNWVYESSNYINGSPAVADGKTIFGGCDAILHVISLADGKELKQIEAGAYIAASVAVQNGRAYFGHFDNEFLCVDLNNSPEGGVPHSPRRSEVEAGRPDSTKNPSENVETNSPVVWRFRDREFAYFSSPAVTRDRVVFGGRDKQLHCVRADDGKPLWSFATRGRVDSSPVIAGDKVVVGSDDGRVYIVSLNDGKELWSYEIGRSVGSSPAVADGKIVIGSDDGNVYCFGEKKK